MNPARPTSAARPARRAAAPGSTSRRRHAPARCGVRAALPAVLLALAIALPLALGGCGGSTTTPPMPDLVSRLTGADQGRILWSVDRPTRGSVRWGLASGVYDHLSYPSAAAGADRDFLKAHEVPLLDAPAGAPIYFQRFDRLADGQLHVAAEETVTFAELPERPPRLEWTSLDVQFTGDAHVLKLPSRGRLVSIDAGNWSVGRRGEPAPVHVARWLEDRAVDTLAVAFATHIHSDHYGGYLPSWDGGQPGLLDRFVVGRFLDVAAVTGNGRAHQTLIDAVHAHAIPCDTIAPGLTSMNDPEALGWDPRVQVAVLNAGAQPEWSGGNINNDSIALRISYGWVDLFSGGDCEVPAENYMLAHYPDLAADVEWMKAFHHGREDENSQNFLAVARPRVCTIPVALSAYDNGYQEGLAETDGTLDRLARLGADVFMSDVADPLGHPYQDGVFWHTTFLTDGSSYEIRIEPSLWGI